MSNYDKTDMTSYV